MSNNFTPFEDKLRDAIEHYELPYDSGSWNDMNNRLNSGVNSNTWVVALVAAVFFTAIGSWTIYKYSFNFIGASAAHRIARFEAIQEVKNSVGVSNFESNETTITDSVTLQNTISEAFASNESSVRRLSNATITPSVSSNANADGQAESASSSNSESSSTEPPVVKPTNSSLTVLASATTVCSGGEVEFSAMNGPKEGSYLWNFGDGNFSNKPNPKHKYMKPGVYDVSLSITSKRDGQINTTVMNDLITIHPTPSADFEWDFVNGASDEPTVKVINTSDNASTYSWKFGDGSTSHEISPIKSYSEKGKQMIVLEVSNEFGCADNKVKYIHINQEYNLMAPDGFSLRSGAFMPEGLKGGKSKFKLTIYNGEQPIYETTSKSKGWDGTLPSGVKAIAGDQYPWIVIIYNENTNEEKYFSGIVTILP